MSGQFDGRPVVPGSGRLRPLGLAAVEITGGFWAERQEVNSTATIAHCHDWMERMGWVGNFRAAVEGRLPQDRKGVVFTDSDVYKLMEAAAWEAGRSGSADADGRFTTLAEVIAPVQADDGYLNTVFGRAGQPPRYSDLGWGHELYCYGHMLRWPGPGPERRKPLRRCGETSGRPRLRDVRCRSTRSSRVARSSRR
jgi:hypothetical protein